MKPTPPPALEGLTFDELVSRAKASETSLSPADLDRMVQRFEARLAEAGALDAQVGPTASGTGAGGQSAIAPTRAGKLGATSKAIWGGVGLSAVAAFIYVTNSDSPAPTVLNAPTAAEYSPVSPSDPVAPEAVDNANEAARHGEASPAPEQQAVNEGTDDHSALANGRTPAQRPRTARQTRKALSTQVSTPLASTTETAVAVEATPPAAPPTTSAPAKPALDTSLAQLERAERELRNGNPSAALTTLAQPVVPSLSSRAEALRAVALCQSGQTAAGRSLGTQHLVRNPRSPYEQRLQRACGEL